MIRRACTSYVALLTTVSVRHFAHLTCYDIGMISSATTNYTIQILICHPFFAKIFKFFSAACHTGIPVWIPALWQWTAGRCSSSSSSSSSSDYSPDSSSSSSSGTSLSYSDAQSIAAGAVSEPGCYAGGGYYSDGYWYFTVYDQDGNAVDSISVSDSTGATGRG